MSDGNRWSRYAVHPQFALGFHGCDRTLGEGILRGDVRDLRRSENEYDWLGHGIYFWESSPQRALEFAEERAAGGRNSKGHIKEPFVIGAFIDLGCCLNLSDRSALDNLSAAHKLLVETMGFEGKPMPTNGEGKLRRNLDCAVIQMLHQVRSDFGEPEYNTVRGAFPEGDPLYPGAGFGAKDHTQICVRTISCIKGYFRPIPD